MQYHSTRDKRQTVKTRKAVELGLAMDGGLFVPEQITPLPSSFWKNLQSLTYQDIAWKVMHPFFGEGLSTLSFQNIIDRVCAIPIPLLEFEDRTIAELWHGPTLAFKDIGATWMAALFGEYQQIADKTLHILVATSGDTGGAVAAAFHQVQGITVTILYPNGKVSPFQEQQMVGLGGNIRTLAVDGTFDDCQVLVKSAFQDVQLRQILRLTSANSINIARWIPQVLPYIEAWRQSTVYPESSTFVVPCGNLGNLSAGLLGEALGLPVSSWLVSTNANNCFIQYLDDGEWSPRPTISTLANAMDVGNPSNIDRFNYLHGSTWNNRYTPINGYSSSDSEIKTTIREVYHQYGTILDPHTATAWQAVNHVKERSGNKPILMSTAHHSKFSETIGAVLDQPLDLIVEAIISKNSRRTIKKDFATFKEYLLLEH